MAKRKKPPIADDPQMQLILENLAELKSMDREIWPSRKPPKTDEAALTFKGMHVTERKA